MSSKNPKGKLFAIRPFVILAVFLSVGIGLALHAGWGTVSSMGWKAIAWICPLGSLETLFASHTGIPRVLITFAVVVVVVLLLGKAFCSWVCPVPPFISIFRSTKKKKKADGTHSAEAKHAQAGGAEADALAVDDAAAEATAAGGAPVACAEARDGEAPSAEAQEAEAESGGSQALANIGGERDGLQIDTRHWVLGGALLSSAIFGFPVFCLICPVGLLLGTFIAVWTLFQTHVLSWSLVVFPAIAIIEVVVFRKWCHTLCPMSALFSLISQGNRTWRPSVDRDTCLREKGVDCSTCVDVCPEELDPHTKHIPECSKCGKCVVSCPAAALSMPFLRPREKAERAEQAAERES